MEEGCITDHLLVFQWLHLSCIRESREMIRSSVEWFAMSGFASSLIVFLKMRQTAAVAGEVCSLSLHRGGRVSRLKEWRSITICSPFVRLSGPWAGDWTREREHQRPFCSLWRVSAPEPFTAFGPSVTEFRGKQFSFLFFSAARQRPALGS
jgi:hypothetical protein